MQLRALHTLKRKVLPPSPGPGDEVTRLTLEVALDTIREAATDPDQAARIFDVVVTSVVAPHHRSVFWGDRLLTLDKAAAFRDDPGFAAAFGAVSSDTGATQYSAPDRISWRLAVLAWAGRLALLVPGDFVECGTYRGDMSWLVTELVDIGSSGRKFYLYDTFAGFSSQYSSEADFPLAPEFYRRADEIFRAQDIYPSVCERFRTKGYVQVVKGVVPDILGSISPSQVAFLHLDMNSAEPERLALERLFPLVSAGGVVVFDDYGWALHAGQKATADQFMRDHDHAVLELPTGQGLVIRH